MTKRSSGDAPAASADAAATRLGAAPPRRSRLRAAVLAAVTILVLAAAYGAGRATRPVHAPVTGPAATTSAPSAPARLRVEVLETRPHDPSAFTQGLVLRDGVLYESTGLYGRSSVRIVDAVTGEVKQRRDLDASLFGEGLALVGDRLIQLTWKEGVAPVYDRESLTERERFRYDGEGWGLCHDGRDLVMSDGSSRLTMRDADTFASRGEIDVRRDGAPVEQLNELECVGDRVWANIWQTDEIIEVDRATGVVLSSVDASGLLAPSERAVADVLNGIAHDPSDDTFLITGKLWPTLFKVRFVPDGAARPTPPTGTRQAYLPEVVRAF